MAGDECLGCAEYGGVGVACVVAQGGECGVGGRAAACHQDAFGLLDDDAASERAVDATELGVAAQDDVQRVGEFGVIAVLDVGEDAAFGGVVDELVVLGRHVGDHWAAGVLDELGDQLEGVQVLFAEADDRDVGLLAARRLRDVCDVIEPCDDDVAERVDDLGDLVQAACLLVCEENPQLI